MRHINHLSALASISGSLFLAGSILAQPITMTGLEPGGDDWNTGSFWSDGNPASVSSAANPAATYELLVPSVMRTPKGASNSVFPGSVLTMDGDGNYVFFNNQGNWLTAAKSSTMLIKGVNSGATGPPLTLTIPSLVMNGGQLEVNVAYMFLIGQLTILTNTPVYMDGSADIGCQISAQMTGGGTFIYEGVNTSTAALSSTFWTNGLDIVCASNTFTGQWNIVNGVLLGGAPGCLGTNTITIGATGGLETAYDINNPNGSLFLNGTMLLHQNDTFNTMAVAGSPLDAGTYTYTQLNSSYPTNFPLTWAQQNGSSFSGASGSIVVLSNIPPSIVSQPRSLVLYSGLTATFLVAGYGSPPLAYQWQKNGVNLTNGANISGATNTVLTIGNISPGDATNYDVVVSGSGTSVTSIVVSLGVVSPASAYESSVISNHPAAYWRLNETNDPNPGPAAAYDYYGGFNGTYGVNAQNATDGILGPVPSAGFPGFESTNGALQTSYGQVNSYVAVPALNLNTNTVTITGWINPDDTQGLSSAIFFCRAGSTIAGFGYAGFFDNNGNNVLGYTWGNDQNTTSWNSGVTVPSSLWSFVALAVSSSNATIYVFNTNGLVSATHVYNHTNEAFDGISLISGDSGDGGNGVRSLSAAVDEVAVFKSALSQAQLTAIYSAGSGVALFAPTISAAPTNLALYAGQTAQFSVTAGGAPAPAYHWMAGLSGSGGPYTNLTNAGNISGATSAILTIANISTNNALDYVVFVTNSLGGITSSPPATLSVLPTGPPEAVTMSGIEPGGNDWNAGTYWSDGNSASISSAAFPGTTYELLVPAVMRTPSGQASTSFSGSILTVDGNGVLDVFQNQAGWATNATIATILVKGISSTSALTLNFPDLVMNGGQIEQNVGYLRLAGKLAILANTPFYLDGSGDIGGQISAQMSGSGTFEFDGDNNGTQFHNVAWTNALDIVCPSNTFTGQWNVVNGTLLGGAPGCLGTNAITVGATGGLETTYDINNPNSGLILNGRILLHQNDTFNTVTVGGATLYAGAYTAAQLAGAYPAYFPTSWAQQNGSTVSTASGGITVLQPPSPTVTLLYQLSDSGLTLNWSQGALVQATNLLGPWTTATTNPPPFVITPTGSQMFFKVLVGTQP